MVKQTKRKQKEREAINILDRLHEGGFHAYIVGGYVRDRVIGMLTDDNDVDIDIATSAKPEEVMKLFPKTVPTGIQHGTVTVVTEHASYEVTTFRVESGYRDHRRPDEVRFVTDLYEDLSRRDFTMNAMAMDRHGAIIDPYNGREDLQRKQLRCVGDAQVRFSEDALRIVRAIRFAAHYGLQIETSTWEALLQERHRLQKIAMERIRMELEKMIASKRADAALALLIRSQLFAFMKLAPFFQQKLLQLSENDTWMFAAFEQALLKWFTLAIRMELTPEQCNRFFRSLTFPNKFTEEIVKLRLFDAQVRATIQKLPVSATDQPLERLRDRWKVMCVEHGVDVAIQWLDWIRAFIDHADHAQGMSAIHWNEDRHWAEQLSQQGDTWIAQMPIHSLHQLAVNGNDLLLLKEKGGPWIGEVLNRLLCDVATGKLSNDKSELLTIAERMVEQADL